MKTYLRIFIVVVCVILNNICRAELSALKIADFYKDAKKGEWIEIEGSDGVVTKTTVKDIKDGVLEIEIKSSKEKEIIYSSSQSIDISKGKIISIRIFTPGSEDREIYPDEKNAGDFTNLEFEKRGEEEIIVPAGEFVCERYRAIYDDYVIDAWINKDVPVIRLVKIKMRDAVARLVGYGADGAPSKLERTSQ